jgi:hypothetical protein
MPRCWWYPARSSEVRDKSIVLEAHQKTSETITKAMLTLLGVALFCLLTALGSPDKLLLAADSTIKVPFADAPISFLGFIVVAPILLSVVAVYLHIFYGYWLELERERCQINKNLKKTGQQQIESVPSLFYFNSLVPRFLTSLIFYWLVPLVFVAITIKALARPEIGRPLIYVTGLVTFTLAFLQMRRRPDNRRRWRTALSCAMLFSIVVLMVFSILNPAFFHRPLNLFRAELPKAWLVKIDMSGANGSYANFEEANVEYVNLYRANLSDSNLQRAKIGTSVLVKANLYRANLQGANLIHVSLQGANLVEANLQGANLVNSNLEGADLRKADLQGATLSHVNLQGAKLEDAKGRLPAPGHQGQPSFELEAPVQGHQGERRRAYQ